MVLSWVIICNYETHFSPPVNDTKLLPCFENAITLRIRVCDKRRRQREEDHCIRVLGGLKRRDQGHHPTTFFSSSMASGMVHKLLFYYAFEFLEMYL